jgi:hypothetical protein
MFDQPQRPFLTVETGEAYQPIRLTYVLLKPDAFKLALEQLKCIEKNATSNSWNWYWQAECDDLHFESLNSFEKKNKQIRLGTFTLRDNNVYLNLTSFKRACLAVSFFRRLIGQDIMTIHLADFINKVFSLDERLPHGFAELFKEDELNGILNRRLEEDYDDIQARCEKAATPEEASRLLAEYTETESKKRLPYAERYLFEINENTDLDVAFLSFYIYLRGRELVAIKRWFGELTYSLSDAANDCMGQVFGEVGADSIE